MRPITRGIVTLATALALAGCSSGGGTPTTAPGPATQAASTAAASGPCTDSTGATTVAVGVANNAWQQPISAKVGDVITWTNADSVPHKVALDDGSCQMTDNIAGGGSKSLVFSVAGSFPFHCAVHPSMKGTITIS